MTTGSPGHAPTIAVLRALKLGDALVALPALRGLRSAFPGHRLVYAGPSWIEPLLALSGAVDEIAETPSLDEGIGWRGAPPDLAVNLHGRGPQSDRRLAEIAPRLLWTHDTEGRAGPIWCEDLHERERWCRLVRWHGAPADPRDVYLPAPAIAPPVGGAVLVHVGASTESRRWPVERFATVARGLAGEGHRVLVTGDAADVERAAAVVRLAGLPLATMVAGQWHLGELMAEVAAARLVVSVDTGVAHLASAFSTSSVVIFGPVPPERWGPPAGPHLVLTAAEERRGDPWAGDPDPALLAVSSAEVLAACERLGVVTARARV